MIHEQMILADWKLLKKRLHGSRPLCCINHVATMRLVKQRLCLKQALMSIVLPNTESVVNPIRPDFIFIALNRQIQLFLKLYFAPVNNTEVLQSP